MIISHGFSSPGIFSIANFNYEVSGRRRVLFQKGVRFLHPISALFWFLLIAANIAAPPTLNLVRELFICMSILKLRFWLLFIVGFSTFFSATYNLYIYASQQGSVSAFILPGSVIRTRFYLSTLLHVIPVYISLFGVCYLFVWKNRLINKIV